MKRPVADPAAFKNLDVAPLWLPFTANRQFKRDFRSRLLVSAEGAYYRSLDGRNLFDALSGLWCCPIGHAHPRIVEAIRSQAETLDYCPAFHLGNPETLRLAQRIAAMAPDALTRVFFTNSGSESVDTALKMAYGYHHARGEAGRFRMIGRERGYHGAGIGGMSVGGISPNRKMFAPLMLNGVDHLPHTLDVSHMAFSRGQPDRDSQHADSLQHLIDLHDASTIAAVIVEPLQGAGGVIVPPIGYLKRLRDICTRHGILLIFDEVITGFGRLGANFAAERFGVVPDMITFAKAITNGVVPMGGVIASDAVYEAFMNGPSGAVEFSHGYTYSGHPLAAAVAHAVLDLMQEEGLVERARMLEAALENAIHSLRGEPGVIDIRNFGLCAAVELEERPAMSISWARRVCDEGLQSDQLLRWIGNTIVMAPPFISTTQEIDYLADSLRRLIRKTCLTTTPIVEINNSHTGDAQ